MDKVKSFNMADLAEDKAKVSAMGRLMVSAIVDNILQPLVDHFDVKIKIISFHKVDISGEHFNSVEIKASQSKSGKLGRKVNNLEIAQFMIRNDIFDQIELIGEDKKDLESIRISHVSINSNRRQVLFSCKSNPAMPMSRAEVRSYRLLK